MFNTPGSERVLFILICVLPVLFLFSTVGCSGKNDGSYSPPGDVIDPGDSGSFTPPPDPSEQSPEQLNKKITDLESEKQDLSLQLSQAEERADKAEAEKGGIEFEKEDLSRKLEQAERQKSEAINRADKAEKKNKVLESERQDLSRKLEQAERQKSEAVNRADKAEEENKVLRSEKEDLDQRLKQAKEKIDLVPQAEINSAILNPDKKNIEIKGSFWVSNRKGLKVRVIAFFSEADGEKLFDRNGKYEHEGRVAARDDFTLKTGEPETNNFELSIPYDELHVGQPRNLEFEVRVYDETRETFLETTPYVGAFHFNPLLDSKITNINYKD